MNISVVPDIISRILFHNSICLSFRHIIGDLIMSTTISYDSCMWIWYYILLRHETINKWRLLNSSFSFYGYSWKLCNDDIKRIHLPFHCKRFYIHYSHKTVVLINLLTHAKSQTGDFCSVQMFKLAKTENCNLNATVLSSEVLVL